MSSFLSAFSRGMLRSFLMMAMVLGFAQLAWPQAETGQINGTVTDPSGGVVSNVTVTIRNAGTGAVRLETSDSKGYYAATNLQPAEYVVTVEVTGFQKQQKAVTLAVGGTIGLNFTLTLGSSSTTVEVNAAAASDINTETPTISTNITQEMVTELPSLTRDPYDFVVAAGSVNQGGSMGRGVNVSINGQRDSDTNVLLDGAANNDEFDATVGQAVPLDSVQEFSVMTTNWSAQYGRATSGVVNLVTKSGSNDFHGTLYEFNRVSALASNGYFNDALGLPKPVYVRNDFGGSVGGPIKKEKLFFFANPEWNRTRSSANQTGLIVDPAFINASDPNTFNTFAAAPPVGSNVKLGQSFSATQLGVSTTPICPSAPSTVACYSATAPLMDYYTYQSPGDSGAGAPTNWYNIVGRIDYNYSDHTSLYVRYGIQNEDDFAGFVSTSPYEGYNSGQNIRNQNILLSLTKVFSPRWVSQSKFVFNRLNLLQPLGTAPVGPTLYLDSQFGASTLVTPTFGPQAVAFPGYNEFTPGAAIPFGGPQNFYEAYQDMSYSHGSNTWRFGGSYTFLQDNRSFGAYEEATEILNQNGNALAGFQNLLGGQLYQFQAAVNPQGNLPCTQTNGIPNVTPQCSVQLPVSAPNFSRSNRYNELAVYGMDEWKVNRRIKVTLGLRWEYFGVQHNKDPNLDSNFYLGGGGSIYQQIANGAVAIAPESPIHGLWSPDYKDFGPRLGFAWDVFGDGKTSLRGGYGISYARNFGNVTFNMIQNPPAYAVLSIFGGSGPGPGGFVPVTPNNFGPLAGSSGSEPIPQVELRNVEQNIKNEYVHQYSMSVQRELASNFSVSVDYSGSKGARQYDIANINMQGMGPIYLGTPCPGGPFTSFNGNFPNDSCSDRLVQSGQYSNINRRGDGGSSSYNSLNFNSTLRNPSFWGHKSNLTFIANYTWAHTIDDLSSTFSESALDFNLGYLNPFNPSLDRGDSELDVRNRIAITAVWNIPFASETHGIVKQALDGWEFAPIFTAETGTPFTIFDCTNAWTQCPRVMTTAPVKRTGSSSDNLGSDTFDYIDFASLNAVSTYVNPTVGVSDFGPFPNSFSNPNGRMLGRNYFRGPGFWNMNVGIYKNFHLTERFNLQFRSELYNAFNHANMSLVADSNVLFSGPPTGSGQEFVEGQKFGNRNIQLGLKLLF